MTLRDTELLCIELVAKEKQHKNNNNNNKNSNNNDNNKQMYVLFVGCLRYSKLKRAFEEKVIVGIILMRLRIIFLVVIIIRTAGVRAADRVATRHSRFSTGLLSSLKLL